MSSSVWITLIPLLIALAVLLVPRGAVVDWYARLKSAISPDIPRNETGAPIGQSTYGDERPGHDRSAHADPYYEERTWLMAASHQRLYDLARQSGIPGRSRMTREQLIEALLAAPTPSARPWKHQAGSPPLT